MLKQHIAYFSMEIGINAEIPSYAGGLGVLAGDTVRSAADLGIRMLAVTLLYRKGYFRQILDASGNQSEQDQSWPVDELLEQQSARCQVEIEGRPVSIRAWKYPVHGANGGSVPVYFLDTDLEANSEQDRRITDRLYGGDDRMRLCQEIVLGIGGVRMLRALGFAEIDRYHMNEGHAALLTLELAYELARRSWEMAYEPIRQVVTAELVQLIKPQCVFTTHTPVPAGHDRFSLELVHRVLTGYGAAFADQECEFCPDTMLDMTRLALENSHYVNGVAKRHGKVAKKMFAAYDIDSITNGVHAATWASPAMARLFDDRIPGWREDNSTLRYALSFPKSEIWSAHLEAKQQLISLVNRAGSRFDPELFTIGFARRAALYKRADLLFHDLERLREIAKTAGPFQLVFAGKSHPRDEDGKKLIRRIHEYRNVLGSEIVYLENYDIEMAKLITSGVDLWLNTPQPPLEASGTSGMKAAVNGVPSFSILDGWWVEGCIEGVTGWAIGADNEDLGDTAARDSQALYDKLESTILPMYYRDRDKYLDVMRNSIGLNGSFFNTERMLAQYITKAYFK